MPAASGQSDRSRDERAPDGRGASAPATGADEAGINRITTVHRSAGISREYNSDWTTSRVKINCTCGTTCEATPTTNYPDGVGAFLLAWRQFREHASGSLGPADAGTQLHAARLLDQLENQRDTWGDHGLALLAAMEIAFAEMQGKIAP